MKYLWMIAIACVVTAAQAQNPKKIYPWDERPPKCFVPDAEPTFQCRTAPEQFPNYEKTVHYISVLYYNETFQLLETYLSELVATKKRFASGPYPEETIFWAFSRIMATGANEAPPLIAMWRKAVPDSKFAWFAEAARVHTTAWEARGSGYANTVSPEAWELFAIRLQDAEQVLLDAPNFTRESPLWHVALLSVALDSNRVRSDPGKIFDEAVKRWPTYTLFYQLALNRMLPKWGGSWEQVEGFIAKANKMQPASEGNSMYTRLYLLLVPERAASESNYDWETLKIGFDDTITRFADPMYKNRYASFACMKRDKATFSKAMGKISREELISAWWLDGSSYESCLRWAGT